MVAVDNLVSTAYICWLSALRRHERGERERLALYYLPPRSDLD